MSDPLAVLAVYNRYLHRGGEDGVFEAEVELLRANGCSVTTLSERTAPPADLVGRLRFGANAIWSQHWRRRFRQLLAERRPDVVHVYNLFPLFSPSIYYASREAGVPVVQTVQNYRLLCPAATLYRRGAPCELCLGRRLAWPGVALGCYHGSRVQTGVVAGMVAAHRALGTWSRLVDVYVAATEFSRRKLVEGGLPGQRIVCKPNFIRHDPGPKSGPGRFALFAGRLSAEKGVPTLLDAWRRLPGVPLKIAGDGPLLEWARDQAARADLAIEVLGRVDDPRVLALMKEARFLVAPSEWYEGFPLVVIEAFASALPVVAADRGGLAEIVQDGVHGLRFSPGDPQSLAASCTRLWERPELAEEMGRRARATLEARYLPEHNYALLTDIYERAGVPPRRLPAPRHRAEARTRDDSARLERR